MTQFLVTTLSNAAIYALVATALSVIFRSSGVLHFGAGHVAAFVGIAFANELGGGVLGISVAMLGGVTLCLLCYVFVVQPGQRIGVAHVPLSLATLGFGLVLDWAAGELWAKQAFTGDSLIPGRLSVFGTTFSAQRIVAVIACVAFVGLLVIFIERSMVGHAMEAAAVNPELAQLYGVRTGLVGLTSWGIAGAALGLAGALQSSLAVVSRASAIPLVVLGIVAAVVSGLGSFTHLLTGAVLVAMAQTAFVLYVSPRFTVSLVFLLLFVVLVLRPAGLFANPRQAERV